MFVLYYSLTYPFALDSGLFWLSRNVYQGSQYAVSESKSNWAVAKYSCERDDAVLATVPTESHQLYLRDSFEDTTIWYVRTRSRQVPVT